MWCSMLKSGTKRLRIPFLSNGRASTLLEKIRLLIRVGAPFRISAHPIKMAPVPTVDALVFGDATTVETLRIEWPSGIDQELHDLPANRFLTIHEPPILTAIGFLGEDQFELTIDSRGGWDYAIESSTNLEVWQFLSNALNVTGEVQVVDPSIGSAPQKFYRAVQPFSAVHGFVRITDQDPAELQLHLIDIRSAKIIRDTLVLEVSHGGGYSDFCGGHDYALFMSPATFAESMCVAA